MIELKKEAEDVKVEPLDAYVFGDYVIPGVSGKSVDLTSSYSKMKSLGEYNSNLLVFVSELPNVSITSYKDKFIVNGNKSKKEVYLVFEFSDDKYLKDVIDILDENKVLANIFLDGYYIENDIDNLKGMIKGHYVGNLGYKGSYDESLIRYTNGLISRNFNESIFCYAKDDDKSILNLCNKNDMYTIKPVMIDESYPYINVKKNISSYNIMSFKANSYLIKELDTIIKFIKQKGYEISLVSNLVFE